MPKFSTTLASCATTGVLLASVLVIGPAGTASASEAVDGVTANGEASTLRSSVTPELFEQAIDEARAAGAVSDDVVNVDGTHAITIDAGGGVTLDLNTPAAPERLSSGSDSYGGLFVGFNAFDQSLVISGGMTAIAAGMCALGPAVCVVANVAAVIASTAITTSGGVQCGNKSLRVYPVTNKKPRCA